ncbi:MAG: tetratricopeptide repeat protein [Planctomycetota bacterium]|jgi:DNA-directed RNA polymerase subunit alpha
MATAEETIEAQEILAKEDAAFDDIVELRKRIHCSIEQRAELERIVVDWPSTAKKFSSENKAETRRGVALWVLGQVEQAVPLLDATRVSKERSFFLGLSYLELDRNLDALPLLKEAYKTDQSDLLLCLYYSEARTKTGDFEGARTILDRLEKKHDDNAEVHYVSGLGHDLQGAREKAMAAYDRALVREPGHPRSLFRMAYIHDLHGEDASAMEYYQQLRKLRPTHVNTMINLGVLLEDRGEYERAAECYRNILDYFPNHSRAKLYYSDAVAALSMYYDEDAARREAKMKALLSQPVADISFSPRVRNALEKLDIQTLSELVARTEEELLTIPNFGKTSLREIKEFLTGKGLNLSAGETPAGGLPDSGAEAVGGDPSQRELSEFEWSGRVAKMFETLELTDEIEKRLSALGLSLPG